MVNAEIISIGDEILIGQITNTNAQWMAEHLNLIGISVTRMTTVADNREEMMNIFHEARKRSDIILITGGLGPTNDDLTKPVLCDFFNTKLIFNEACFEDVKKIFSDRNLYMPESNRHQAEVPENCTPIRNYHGTAPGMWFEVDENNQPSTKTGSKIFVSLPGVPYEMRAMMEESVLPTLKNKFTKQVIVHKTVYTQGIGESTLAEKIQSWENSLASLNISLAYLPEAGGVKLRLTSRGENKNQLIQNIDAKIDDLKQIIPQAIFAIEEFGKEKESIEKVIGRLLKLKNKTLAVAESCTGGYIGHLITSIAGSSDYFLGGVISYANQVKISELGVSAETLKNHGAVSKEVAEQMAIGVRKKLGSDYAISTTGIAGPTGGTLQKPVGTVWIGISSKKTTTAELFHMGNNRERNIRKVAITALTILRNTIE